MGDTWRGLSARGSCVDPGAWEPGAARSPPPTAGRALMEKRVPCRVHGHRDSLGGRGSDAAHAAAVRRVRSDLGLSGGRRSGVGSRQHRPAGLLPPRRSRDVRRGHEGGVRT